MARLEKTFDRRSKTVKQEVAAFQRELAEFERSVAPAAIITRTKRAGHLLHISAMSAQLATSPAATSSNSWVEPWRP
ncbi:MAG: hypothetical protein JNJ54_34080 [Myxococcaceae bacterium]|nr:hypothetical protein [Myxococcaceae bacterium]